jgi:hypothetical protein
MKRNFNVKLTNLNGVVLVQRVPHPENVTEKDEHGNEIKGADGHPVVQTTLQELIASDLICTALLSPFNDEQPSADEKHKRFKLAQRINAGHQRTLLASGSEPDGCAGEVDITSEEATLIKTLTAKLYAPLVVGQLIDIIEG